MPLSRNVFISLRAPCMWVFPLSLQTSLNSALLAVLFRRRRLELQINHNIKAELRAGCCPVLEFGVRITHSNFETIYIESILLCQHIYLWVNILSDEPYNEETEEQTDQYMPWMSHKTCNNEQNKKIERIGVTLDQNLTKYIVIVYIINTNYTDFYIASYLFISEVMNYWKIILCFGT